MGVITEWSTNFPTTQDTDPNADTEQPDLINESGPGTNDGSTQRFSHLLTLRNKLHELAKLVGDVSNDPPGSLKSVINTITGETTFNYLPTTNPTGVVSPPEVVYQFDGTGSTLLDRTANGHDLSLAAGTTTFKPVNGFLGLYFDGLTHYTAPSSAGLEITGDLTIEAIIFLSEYTGVDKTIISHAALGETEADNFLYRLAVKVNTGIFEYFSENGAGNNSQVLFDAVNPVATIHHIAFTRNAVGDVDFYQDGILIDSKSSTAPTGGTSGILRIGEDTAVTEPWTGNIFSLRMTPEVFSGAQVLESYKTMKGIV